MSLDMQYQFLISLKCLRSSEYILDVHLFGFCNCHFPLRYLHSVSPICIGTGLLARSQEEVSIADSCHT